MRKALASGALPLGGQDTIGVLVILENDPDDEVRGAVKTTWDLMEKEFVAKVLLDKSLHSTLMEAITKYFPNDVEIAKLIVTHKNATGSLLEHYVNSSDKDLLVVLADNQRILLENVSATKKLIDNPELDPAVRGRLRSLIGYEEEVGPPASEEVDPFSDEAFSLEDTLENLDDIELPEELPDELFMESETANDSANMQTLIQKLSISEKIKLATLGSKSARKLLARDSNRLVATAVIRSPKIREDEVVPIALDRTTADDVLSYIMTRKEWLKNYQIKLALVQNPKTPIPKAMRLLELLQERDLRTLSRSRSVPKIIASSAGRVLVRRHKN
jgi:hypothetical protein